MPPMGGGLMQLVAVSFDTRYDVQPEPVYPPITVCWMCNRKKQGKCKRRTCRSNKNSSFYEDLRKAKEERIAKRLKIKMRKKGKKESS